ncbi:MAG: alpha/beta fold hydrolase [Euryarchaeota archaeon]|nr:alpha/beta fold hydrolase [Euryarchaeota archaeon]
MPYLKVGNAHIHYHMSGSGEPLVLIPGLFGNLYNWKKMVPILEKRYHVVLVDNRGAGRTEAPDEPFTMEDMADDVASLMGALDIPRYHVMGWSMGGNVAQEVAIRHPEEVASLILMSTYSRRPERSSYAIDAMLRTVKEGASLDTFLQMMNTWCLTQSHYAGRKLKASRRKYTDADRIVEGFCRQKIALDLFDSTTRLPLITCPTLVIHGDEDIMVPTHMGEELAQGIVGSELTIVRGAGHIIPPEGCSRSILSFLGRHPLEVDDVVGEAVASAARD